MLKLLYTISITDIILYLILAILVLRVWNYGKAHRRLFFLLITSAFWLIIGVLEISIRNNLEIYRFLINLDYITAAFVAYFFLIFAFHFPKVNIRLNPTRELLFFLPIILVTISSLRNWVFVVKDYGNTEFNTPLYLTYIILLISYFVILGGGILVSKYKKSIGLLRLQLKYFIAGYIVSISVLLYLSIQNALVEYLPDITYAAISNIAIVFAIAISYVILRHRLMDIRVVLRKGFVHAISLIILLALYTYLILSFQNYFELNRPLTTLIAVLVICLTIYPLRKFLSRNIDALFFAPEKRDVSLQKFSSSLASGIGLEELLEKAKIALTQGLDVLEVKIFILDENQREFKVEYPREIKGRDSIDEENELVKYLKDKKEIVIRGEIPYLIQGLEGKEAEEFKEIEKELKRENAEVVVPLMEENIFGLIFLGNKKSQAAFTVQDIRFLNSFSRQFTIYLGNVLLYQQALKRVEKMAGAGEGDRL